MAGGSNIHSGEKRYMLAASWDACRYYKILQHNDMDTIDIIDPHPDMANK